jgi:hypothetical protein
MVLPFALLILFWVLIFLILIGIVFKLFKGFMRGLGEAIRSFKEGMRKS